jgi:type VI protein secretion system component VasA
LNYRTLREYVAIKSKFFFVFFLLLLEMAQKKRRKEVNIEHSRLKITMEEHR